MAKKVLVVDDEQDIVETLKFMIEMEGYDGEQGLNKAKELMPDLIILDVMMPFVNGYKVSRMLKFDARYKDIPILMLTARSQESDKELGEETGANEYITKPFDINYVMERVKAYLG